MNTRTTFHFSGKPISLMLKEAIKGLPDKAKILDLGCGEGGVLVDLLRQDIFKPNHHLYAVDSDPLKLNIVRQRVGGRVRLIADDALRLKNVQDNSLDFVYCMMLIEHLEKQVEMLNQVRRCLRLGGLFYITTIIKKPYGWYFYKNKYNKSCLDPGHVKEFKDSQEINQLVCSQGFRLKKFNTHLTTFSVIEALCQLVARSGLLKNPSSREIFLRNKPLNFLRKNIKIPIIGFQDYEGLFEKL